MSERLKERDWKSRDGGESSGGSNPLLCAKVSGTVFRPADFVITEYRRGFEGGDDCGSNRFAGESFEYKNVCRKLNSAVRCSSGRAAKGANPLLCAKWDVS